MATIASDAPYREFALRLAGLREKSGMSRSQLAEKCGIAARSIINYENGTRIPFGDTCARMAEAFGITTDELLGVSRAASVKAGAVADMRAFGPKAPERLRQALDTIGSTFAGGELEEEQMEEYVLDRYGVVLDRDVITYVMERAENENRFPDYEELETEVTTAVDSILEDKSNIRMEQIIWNRRINNYIKKLSY